MQPKHLYGLLAALGLLLAACGDPAPIAAGGILAAPITTSAAPTPAATATVPAPTATTAATISAATSATTAPALPPTDTAIPLTDTAIPPTDTAGAPTHTAVPPTAIPPTATPKPPPTATAIPFTPTLIPPTPIQVGIPAHKYDAYLQAAVKAHQNFHYSCEFDAAWVILKTYGYDVSLDQQLSIVGVDTSVEPYYKQTASGGVIYGGDVFDHYSGNYATNFLARTTGSAMRKVFAYYGFGVTAVHSKAALQNALQNGQLVWIKTTADFKVDSYHSVPVKWIAPDGRSYTTVLGNDHAVVVIGYNANVVVIRDVLGPTSTNVNRQYEYEVPWGTFLTAWGLQGYDGLAVSH